MAKQTTRKTIVTQRSGSTPATGREHGVVAPAKKPYNVEPTNPNLKLSSYDENYRVFDGKNYHKDSSVNGWSIVSFKGVENIHRKGIQNALNKSLAKYGDAPAPWTEQNLSQSPSATKTGTTTNPVDTEIAKMKKKQGKGRLGTLLTQNTGGKMATLLGQTSL